MNVNLILGALAAGIVAGFALAYIEKTWPTAGVGGI